MVVEDVEEWREVMQKNSGSRQRDSASHALNVKSKSGEVKVTMDQLQGGGEPRDWNGEFKNSPILR